MVLNLRYIAPDIGRFFFNLLESENSTDNAFDRDFAENTTQNFDERLDIGHNPAVDSVADSIYDELRAGREVRLMTNSFDEPFMSRALQDVKNRLMLEDRLTPRKAENLMSKIRVETFGRGAAL